MCCAPHENAHDRQGDDQPFSPSQRIDGFDSWQPKQPVDCTLGVGVRQANGGCRRVHTEKKTDPERSDGIALVRVDAGEEGSWWSRVSNSEPGWKPIIWIT